MYTPIVLSYVVGDLKLNKTNVGRENMHIIIIGFGTAGWLTTVNLRKWNRKDEITIIDEKTYDIYHPCSQPYVIGGEIKSSQEITESFNEKRMKVNFYRRHRVIKIDRSNKKVFVKNLETGEEFELQYDYLILTTGSHPWSPPIPRLALQHGAFPSWWP